MKELLENKIFILYTPGVRPSKNYNNFKIIGKKYYYVVKYFFFHNYFFKKKLLLNKINNVFFKKILLLSKINNFFSKKNYYEIKKLLLSKKELSPIIKDI